MGIVVLSKGRCLIICQLNGLTILTFYFLIRGRLLYAFISHITHVVAFYYLFIEARYKVQSVFPILPSNKMNLFNNYSLPFFFVP